MRILYNVQCLSINGFKLNTLLFTYGVIYVIICITRKIVSSQEIVNKIIFI